MYLAPPLAVTFPFNVLVGIFVYHQIAVAMARGSIGQVWAVVSVGFLWKCQQ